MDDHEQLPRHHVHERPLRHEHVESSADSAGLPEPRTMEEVKRLAEAHAAIEREGKGIVITISGDTDLVGRDLTGNPFIATDIEDSAYSDSIDELATIGKRPRLLRALSIDPGQLIHYVGEVRRSLDRAIIGADSLLPERGKLSDLQDQALVQRLGISPQYFLRHHIAAHDRGQNQHDVILAMDESRIIVVGTKRNEIEYSVSFPRYQGATKAVDLFSDVEAQVGGQKGVKPFDKKQGNVAARWKFAGILSQASLDAAKAVEAKTPPKVKAPSN